MPPAWQKGSCMEFVKCDVCWRFAKAATAYGWMSLEPFSPLTIGDPQLRYLCADCVLRVKALAEQVTEGVVDDAGE